MLTTVTYLGISFAPASRALQRFLMSKLCRAEHSGAKEQSIRCKTNYIPSQLHLNEWRRLPTGAGPPLPPSRVSFPSQQPAATLLMR
jgi:hypothetical protein